MSAIPTPFADIEAGVASDTMRMLANAVAAVVGGSATEFPVIFDRAALESPTGITASAPVLTALDADVAGFAAHTTRLTVRGATFTVIDIQPDGAGMTLLVLEVA